MREYKDLPDPTLEPEKFNQYLIDNNKVVKDTIVWLIIENRYIEGQLVAFCKYPVKDIAEYRDINYPSKDIAFIWLFEYFSGKHIYINADKDKSVLNRLHFHIRL